MFKKILIIILLVTSYSLLVTKCNAEEQITITTYYPSPYGSYRELRAKRMAIGETYYSGANVCWSPDSCTYIIPTGAFDPDVDLVIEGKVGIGTPSPGYKLDVAGDVGATSFIYTSDRNLKKNIATIDSPLEKILKLRGVSFNWKKDGAPSVGLIAQEVEKVFPELVVGKDGEKGVQYGNLVAPLIEAVKEQQTQINNLTSEIELLKSNK